MRISDYDEQIYTFVASTSDPDRHRTVLNQEGWELESFNENPIIGYQHNVYGGDLCNAPDPDDVIGRGRAYMEDGKLMLDVVFDEENEKAMKIKSKVDRGFLNAVSVGFIEIGEGRNGTKDLEEDPELYYFEGQELLEVSIVNIPSNPKAQKKALRSQAYDALRYIYQQLGGEYRLADIGEMKINEVIDMLDGKEKKEGFVKVNYYHNGKLVKTITRKKDNV